MSHLVRKYIYIYMLQYIFKNKIFIIEGGGFEVSKGKRVREREKGVFEKTYKVEEVVDEEDQAWLVPNP